jgi:hypothetical protein
VLVIECMRTETSPGMHVPTYLGPWGPEDHVLDDVR